MNDVSLKLSLLGEVSNKINSTLDLDELLTVIMQSAMRILRAEGSSLLLIDEEKENLIFNVAIGDKAAELKSKTVPIGQGFAGIVAQSGQPLLSNDVGDDPRHFKEIDRLVNFSTRNLIAVPMKVKDKMVGVLEVINSREREVFSRKDVALLGYLADQAAIAINNRELVQALEDRVRELTCLYEIAQTISYIHDQDRLFKTALAKISEVMDVERASFLFLDQKSGLLRIRAAIGIDEQSIADILIDPEEGISGHVFKTGDPLLVRDISREASFQASSFSSYRTGSFLSVPIVYQNRTSGVLNVADKRSGQHFTWFDLRILSTIAGQIVEAYRNIDLEKEQFENRDLRKELDIAASIQRRLLPICSIDKPGFSGYARIRMAQAVGGDFYSFFEMGNGRFGVAIADVSGKSIPAAIFGTMLRNGFLKISRETPLPGEVLYRLNQALHPDSEAGMFATMAYLVCDVHNHLLITASAGHLPVYLLRVAEERIEELNPSGIPLAIQEKSLYREKATIYGPGDLLFFHTDGITEERFRDGSEFGEERLKAFLLAHAACEPEKLTELLMDTLEEGSGHRPEEDDYTCIAIRL